jgi:hypothetical protein
MVNPTSGGLSRLFCSPEAPPQPYASARLASLRGVHHLREADDCGLALPPGRAVVEEARALGEASAQ